MNMVVNQPGHQGTTLSVDDLVVRFLKTAITNFTYQPPFQQHAGAATQLSIVTIENMGILDE